MTSQEERLKILDMIAQGQISVEQGSQLLDATTDQEPVVSSKPIPKPQANVVKSVSTGTNGKRLRVLVTSKSGGSRVNVNLPLRLMEVGLKIGGRFVDELKDMDEEMALLMQAIQDDVTGKIVEVDDDDEHVEIFIE